MALFDRVEQIDDDKPSETLRSAMWKPSAFLQRQTCPQRRGSCSSLQFSIACGVQTLKLLVVYCNVSRECLQDWFISSIFLISSDHVEVGNEVHLRSEVFSVIASKELQ